jgi:hypothetical protein
MHAWRSPSSIQQQEEVPDTKVLGHGRTDTGHRHGSNGWRPVGSSQRAALPGAQAQDVRTEQLPSCLLCSVSAALVAAASCPLSSRAVDGAGTPGRPEQEAVCGRASEAVYTSGCTQHVRQQEWMQRQTAGCGGASPVFNLRPQW